jgi:hypothetical protein
MSHNGNSDLRFRSRPQLLPNRHASIIGPLFCISIRYADYRMDPMDLIQEKEEEKEESRSRLNAAVAVTIALLATFMGICKVKDDNIFQAMQQAQANKIDYWDYYQAKNTQQKLFETALLQLQLQGVSGTNPKAAAAEKKLEGLAAHEKSEKEKVKKQAEDADADYNKLNYRDDQFDLSDAALAVAISLLAVTSLTQKRFLFWFAMIPTVGGVLMGLAGLFGWHIHPDAISSWLSFIWDFRLWFWQSKP